MRDILALALIKLARRFTTFGDTDDFLQEAQEYQQRWITHLYD